MKLIVTIIGLFAFTNLFSQDFKRIESQFDFGPTMTIPYKKTVETWPGVIDGPQTAYSTNFGYFFEYIICYNISNRIAFYSGLNYNLNQYKIDEKFVFMERKGNLTSSNLYIPAFIRYRLSENIPFLLSAGPYFNLLIHTREKGTLFVDTAEIVYIGEHDPLIELMNPIQKYDDNTTKEYPSFDYGLSAQVDYEFMLNKKIDAIIYSRFNYGIKRKTGSNLVSISTSNYWRNYTLMIGFGIKL
ncbi:MAG: outer membrane beta-barrel protein [Bacteroidales bacterium]|nr:outer membrane beta-barrel protein [Bacteroidales bacterium]